MKSQLLRVVCILAILCFLGAWFRARRRHRGLDHASRRPHAGPDPLQFIADPQGAVSVEELRTYNLHVLCRQVKHARRLTKTGGFSSHCLPSNWDSEMEQRFRMWCNHEGYAIESLSGDAVLLGQ